MNLKKPSILIYYSQRNALDSIIVNFVWKQFDNVYFAGPSFSWMIEYQWAIIMDNLQLRDTDIYKKHRVEMMRHGLSSKESVRQYMEC